MTWSNHSSRSIPALAATLRSRGKRGCNFWIRMQGSFPPSSNLARADGSAWGEWRSDRHNTMIHGIHPEGGCYTGRRKSRPSPCASRKSSGRRTSSCHGSPTTTNSPAKATSQMIRSSSATACRCSSASRTKMAPAMSKASTRPIGRDSTRRNTSCCTNRTNRPSSATIPTPAFTR